MIGELPRAPEWEPRSPSQECELRSTERTLAAIWSEVLGVAHVRADDDFFSLGGDSLLSIRVVTKAKARGIALNYRMIFRNPTVRQLAASVQAGCIQAPRRLASVSVPLTPIQERFFESAGLAIHHWNQWILLDVRNSLKFRDLYLSVQQLFRAHDALRLKLRLEGGAWIQEYGESQEELPVEWIHLGDSAAAEQDTAVNLLIEEMNKSLNPQVGNLIRVAYVDLGVSRAHRLLIVAHHLIIDNVSFAIIVDDLDACLLQCSRGVSPKLEKNTCTYAEWAEALVESARTGVFEPEGDYWLAQAAPTPRPIPCDMPESESANTYADLRSCEVSFSQQQTLTIINRLPRLLNCHVNGVLLNSLARALYECFGVEETVIDIETHGRRWIDDSVDLRKTTGWYTSIFPLRIASDCGRSAYERIGMIDRQLRAVPNGGVGYGVLRYLSKGGISNRLRNAPGARVCFNYLGQIGRGTRRLAMLNTENMRIGSSHSEDLRRLHLLLFQSAVTEGKLAIQCHYSERCHREDTIRNLLNWLQRDLNGLLPSVANSFRRSFGQLTGKPVEANEMSHLLENVTVFYPLLGIQTSILFQHLSAEGAMPPYVLQVHCTLVGNLVVSAFEKAWQTVVSRHESLRTSFHWADLDAPVQAVHRTVDLAVGGLDWRHKDTATQNSDLKMALRKDRAAGFVLGGTEPLMRVVVIRLAEDRYFCIWSHHHIQLDGWSQVIVIREVFQIYQAIVSGKQVSLSSPPSLGDYFRSLDGYPSRDAEKYWRQYLKGFREPTPIVSTEFAGEGAPSGKGATYGEVVVQMSPTDTDAVREFAKANGLTLHTIFRAVWGLWLVIHSTRDEVVFGNVVSGRSLEMDSVDALVGALINTIPVRMRVEDGIGLPDWLRRVQDEQASSQRYELFPLADVLKLAETPRGRLLFDSILVFENIPGSYADIVSGAGFHLEAMDFKIQENYPVVVSVRMEEMITMRVSYGEDRVDPRIRAVDSFVSTALSLLRQPGEQSPLQFRNSVKDGYFKLLKEKGERHGTRRQSDTGP